MKWWGWGDEGTRAELGAGAREMLAERVGPAEAATRPELAQVRLPDPRALPAELAAALGEGRLTSGHEERVRHAAGRSYPDLIRLRSGTLAAVSYTHLTLPTTERV